MRGLILAVGVLILGACASENKKKTTQKPKKPKVEIIQEYQFGIRTDTAVVVNEKIKKNQFFSDLLTKYKIGYSRIDELVKNTSEVFNPKNLRAGKKYSVIFSKDSTAKYFVYEPNRIEYIVFDLGDSLSAEKFEREIITKIKEASGIINSSLSITMEENGLNYSLAQEIADIYAWTIDFYRIQKGDYFKVIYEEKFVEGESIGVGEIKACLFNHYKEDNIAFYFDVDTTNQGYYDDQGKSLKKAFLKAPLKFSRISSRFSLRRFHPVQKRYKAHLGTDYAAPRGTPIWTTADGVVSKAGYTRGNGNYVKVKHNGTYSTQYLHMSKIKKGIKVGVRVRQGDVIGYVGSTGLATGPHVCYRFWKNGRQVNPFAEKFPPSKPIKEEFQPQFDSLKTDLYERLQKIELVIEDSTTQKPSI